MKTIEQIVVTLRNFDNDNFYHLYINVNDTSLSEKWLGKLNNLLENQNHLEKNYLFHGWHKSQRNGEFLCDKINQSIKQINFFNDKKVWQNNGLSDYEIRDTFDIDSLITAGPIGDSLPGGRLDHDKMNILHHYFEDLQGTSESLSKYYKFADYETKWHIRQLNNLCHELESWALSKRNSQFNPEWQRPSMILCWLNSPRFDITEDDYENFGIDTISRDFGGVYLGVNKSVGKHHYEVFKDESGADVTQLQTTAMKGQTVANGDFDIEWGRSDKNAEWRIKENRKFTDWLTKNGFDPDDKSLTIGHPKVAQTDLIKSFGTDSVEDIWNILNGHLDVYKIQTSTHSHTFDYHWSDPNYMATQIDILKPGYDYSSKN